VNAPPPPTPMARRFPLPLALAAALAAVLFPGCDSFLDLEPPDRLTDSVVIEDAEGARQALIGSYTALQSRSYYGGTYLFMGDLSADNTVHGGTSVDYADADANNLRAGNGAVEAMYSRLYYAISINNHILEKVPGLTDLEATEKNEILGEAHFLRALHHHNLVRLWGDVPVITQTIVSVEQSSQVSRAPVAEVYAQILDDLAQAEGLITNATQTTQASLGSVRALRARVLLYNGDWAGAEQAAIAVEGMGYTLAPVYGTLFSATATTPEDIFRVAFDAQSYNDIFYNYRLRREFRVAPELLAAYSPTGDARRTWNILTDSQGRVLGNKYRDTNGRFAEVVLTRAEALARQGRLAEAVVQYNRIRVRAGLAAHVLGTDVTSEDEVLAAIWNERRLEFAFEGDRWPDLVRTGRVPTVMGIPATAALYPIPQRELDIAPNMTQNPGY